MKYIDRAFIQLTENILKINQKHSHRIRMGVKHVLVLIYYVLYRHTVQLCSPNCRSVNTAQFPMFYFSATL